MDDRIERDAMTLDQHAAPLGAGSGSAKMSPVTTTPSRCGGATELASPPARWPSSALSPVASYA